MKKIYILCWMLMIVSMQAIRAQNAPVTSIGNVSMSSSTIIVPITAVNFTNIGSCDLKIIYDPAIVLPTAVTIGPLLGGSMNTNLTVPGEIILGWYSYPGKTVANNSVIFTISFQRLNSGTTTLSFSDNGYSCMFYNGSWAELNDLPTVDYYINGSIIVPPLIKLKGQLLYDNSASTPINGASIQLLNTSNVVIATTTTASYTDTSIPGNTSEIKGYYQFNAIPNGNYKLRVVPGISWGGVNATDALLIKRHTVGLSYLSGLTLRAADLNLSNSINSTDALQLQLRFVGILTQFAAGDWVFEDTTVVVTGGAVLHNLKVLSMGDVNSSYNPSTQNKTNEVYTALQKEGLALQKENQEYELQLGVNEFMRLGALSLDLSYN